MEMEIDGTVAPHIGRGPYEVERPRHNGNEALIGRQQPPRSARSAASSSCRLTAHIRMPLAGFAKTMPFHHALDRFAVHAGLLCRIAHVPVMPFQEFEKKTAFE